MSLLTCVDLELEEAGENVADNEEAVVAREADEELAEGVAHFWPP